MSDIIIRRRRILLGVAGAGALLLPGPMTFGCGGSSDEGAATPYDYGTGSANGYGSLGGVSEIVDTIVGFLPNLLGPVVGAALAAVYNAIKAIISGIKGIFSAGEMLSTSLQSKSPGNVVSGDGASQLQLKFTGSRSSNTAVPKDFATPIARYSWNTSKDANFYMQLTDPDAEFKHSLVASIDNERAFLVHHEWLDFLMKDNSCGFKPAGDTVFAPCGINGCPVRMMKQDFLRPNQKTSTIQTRASRWDEYSESVRAEHYRHRIEHQTCKLDVEPGKKEYEDCP